MAVDDDAILRLPEDLSWLPEMPETVPEIPPEEFACPTERELLEDMSQRSELPAEEPSLKKKKKKTAPDSASPTAVQPTVRLAAEPTAAQICDVLQDTTQLSRQLMLASGLPAPDNAPCDMTAFFDYAMGRPDVLALMLELREHRLQASLPPARQHREHREGQ